jgi:hypothetical protein
VRKIVKLSLPDSVWERGKRAAVKASAPVATVTPIGPPKGDADKQTAVAA